MSHTEVMGGSLSAQLSPLLNCSFLLGDLFRYIPCIHSWDSPQMAVRLRTFYLALPDPCCLPTPFLQVPHWAEMDTTGYIHMRSRVQGCVAWTEQSGVALSILGVHQHMPLSLGMENCSLSCVDTDFAPLPLSASIALNSSAGDCFHQVERYQGLSQQEGDFLVSEKNRNPE